MGRFFFGLIHSGPCQGMVAPALGEGITERELECLVHDALCFLCGQPVPDDQLEAEYAELPDLFIYNFLKRMSHKDRKAGVRDLMSVWPDEWLNDAIEIALEIRQGRLEDTPFLHRGPQQR